MPRFRVNSGTAKELASLNNVLALGEVAIESDTLAVVSGDGLTSYGKLSPKSSMAAATTVVAPESTGAIAKAVGTSTQYARADHMHGRTGFTGVDLGYIAQNFDLIYCGSVGTILPTAGTVNVLALHLADAASVTNVLLYVTAAGSVLTSGQCFAGLFQGGTLIGATATQHTAWQSTGLKTMALASGPFAVAAGTVYVALFANGTTMPMFANAGAFVVNGALAATASRFGTADTGRTTTFAGTLGTIAAGPASYWAAVS